MILTAILAAIAAVLSSGLTATGVVYAARRSGLAAERAAASERSAEIALAQSDAVTAAHEALVGTIREQRTEIADLRSDMAELHKEVDHFRSDLLQCNRERNDLRRQLEKLRGGGRG